MTTNFSRLFRKVHYWGAFMIAIPIGIIIVTGILLQVKKQSEWVQPNLVKGSGTEPTLSFVEIVEAVKGVPILEVNEYSDIDRIDVRSSDGTIKIRSKNYWEVQIDEQTAEVLHVALRRADIIEDIHDGSWFHKNVKLGVVLPVGLVMIASWLTGVYMFGFPFFTKRRKQKSAPTNKRQRNIPTTTNWKKLLRKIHYWGTLIIAIPAIIVIVSGTLLVVADKFSWIRPKLIPIGVNEIPTVSFVEILSAVQSVPEAQVSGFDDLYRLEVVPAEGTIKVRTDDNWEIQIDPHSGEVLQSASYTSDIIEAMHDGSWFHEQAKLGVFLPSAITLFTLWFTGVYLLALPFWAKRKRRERQKQSAPVPGSIGEPQRAK